MSITYYTIDSLLDMQLPPAQFIVKNLISTGVTLLSAAPKTGKSLLTLQLAIAVASGNRSLGRDVAQGAALILHPDDPSERRLRDRAIMLGAPDHDLLYSPELRLLAQGGIDDIAEVVGNIPNLKLIVGAK